jgi:glutamine synthetase
MFERDRSLSHSLCGPVLVCACLLSGLAVPAMAASGNSLPASQSVASAPKVEHVDPVEARIRDLHDKLQISESQAGQWEAVAHTMRMNAKDIEALVKEKRVNEKDMTAVDDLRAYQEISLAHAKAAKKLADVFEVLYQTMSDDQKKLADAVFRQHKQNAATAGK